MMSNKLRLLNWIGENRKDLKDRIGPMTLKESRTLLNDETGLNVMLCDRIEESCARYLEAFENSLTKH